MAKFYGVIGYVEQTEVKPGDWREVATEKYHSGDLLRDNRRLQSSGQAIDNITMVNTVSIVANPYANEHYFAIRYVVLHGVKWKITNVEVVYPRIILTIGGVYNDH